MRALGSATGGILVGHQPKAHKAEFQEVLSMSKSATFGVIIGNRGFFPDALARDGRKEIPLVTGIGVILIGLIEAFRGALVQVFGLTDQSVVRVEVGGLVSVISVAANLVFRHMAALAEEVSGLVLTFHNLILR
jgi:hypothetical protein